MHEPIAPAVRISGKRDSSTHHHLLEVTFDCNCARIETKASIHHPLWVVAVFRIGFPNEPIAPAVRISDQAYAQSPY